MLSSNTRLAIAFATMMPPIEMPKSKDDDNNDNQEENEDEDEDGNLM